MKSLPSRSPSKCLVLGKQQRKRQSFTKTSGRKSESISLFKRISALGNFRDSGAVLSLFRRHLLYLAHTVTRSKKQCQEPQELEER